MAHLPFPNGSYAIPIRGPKLLFELGLTSLPKGEQLTVVEIAWAALQAAPFGKIRPLAYFDASAFFEAATICPVAGSIVGALLRLKRFGSKFTSVLLLSEGDGK